MVSSVLDRKPEFGSDYDGGSNWSDISEEKGVRDLAMNMYSLSCDKINITTRPVVCEPLEKQVLAGLPS